MKKLVILLLSVFCMVFAFGCGKQPPAITYEITFKQEGQQDIVKVVSEGETLTDIPTPAPKTGYWVTWDREDFSNITEDITVGVTESIKVFTVYYDSNGGEEITETTQITYGEPIVFKETTKSGYILSGYEYEGQKITSVAWLFDADTVDVTVKVLWNYQIVFRQTGYDDIVKNVAEGTSISQSEIPEPNLRTGYTVAWSMQDFSQVNTYTVVTAVETPNKYRVYYDGITAENIPDGVKVPTDAEGKYYYEITFGEAFDKQNLLKPTSQDKFEIFDYWQGLEVADTSVWNIAQDITVTPVYRDNSYKWTFVGVDGIGNETTVDVTLVNGQTLARDFDTPIVYLPQRDGHIAEWDTDFWNYTSGGGTVRPKYTPIKYKVKYKLADDTEYKEETFTYGEPYSLPSEISSVDGRKLYWEYKGETVDLNGNWKIIPEDGTVLINPGTYEHIAVEIILTPVWKNIVTFVLPDKMGNVEAYVKTGEKLTEIPDIIQNGPYRYEWDFDFTKPITQNVDVVLRERIIKVTFNSNGGTLVDTNGNECNSVTYYVKYGREYEIKVKVKFKHFEFDYWEYQEEEVALSGIWKLDVKEIVLTAKRGAYISGNY